MWDKRPGESLAACAREQDTDGSDEKPEEGFVEIYVGKGRMTPLSSKSFKEDESGAVLLETLIALPVLILLTFGLLEFGNLMWQRQQIQIGVRDAARYWARCRPSFMPCSEAIARNIAFYGNPQGAGNLRVPNWDGDVADEFQIQPAAASLPANPDDEDIVIVQATLVYEGSPTYNTIVGGGITIGYYHTQRYLGW